VPAWRNRAGPPGWTASHCLCTFSRDGVGGTRRLVRCPLLHLFSPPAP
jgi:hypothetical protein